jgi:hypothetical protein
MNKQYPIPTASSPGSGGGGGGGGTPGGSNGDIQYNNAGAFGGSAATATAGGNISTPGNVSLTTDGAFLYINSILSAGSIGIGGPTTPAAAPTSIIYIVGDVNGAWNDAIEVHTPYASGATFYTHTSSAAFRAPTINLRRSRGTQAAPTAVVSGDVIGYPASVFGYNGSSYVQTGLIEYLASENYGASSGSDLAFNYTSKGTTGIVEGFRINSTNNTVAAVIPYDTAVGYRISNAATSGNYLRGNGTNFVSSTIQSGDLPAGVPIGIANVNLTAQSAAITATNLIASAPQTGMYRISWSADITTAATTSSVLGGTNGFQVGYTSPTDSVAKLTVPGNSVTSAQNTTATADGNAIVIYAKTGTAITYQFDYTSTGVTAMVYELHVKLESM